MEGDDQNAIKENVDSSEVVVEQIIEDIAIEHDTTNEEQQQQDVEVQQEEIVEVQGEEQINEEEIIQEQIEEVQGDNGGEAEQIKEEEIVQTEEVIVEEVAHNEDMVAQEQIEQVEQVEQIEQVEQVEQVEQIEEVADVTESTTETSEAVEETVKETIEAPPLTIAAPQKVLRQVTSQSNSDGDMENIENNAGDDVADDVADDAHLSHVESLTMKFQQHKSEEEASKPPEDINLISTSVKGMTEIFSKPGEGFQKPSSAAPDTSVISTSVKDLTGAFSTPKDSQTPPSAKGNVNTRGKVTIDQEGLPIFNEVKNGQGKKFLIYGIVDSTIKLLEVGEKDATIDEFISKLDDNECRYCIIHHVFDKVDQYGKRQATKLFFISWIPVSIPPLSKMKYASERGAFVANFSGVSEISCSSKDEVLAALS